MAGILKIIGIYQIKSKIKPEHIYLGSSLDINTRWKLHLSNLKRNRHHSPKLQNHYNKYGKEDLIFSIIIECGKETLLAFEQYYIDIFNPYFNISKVAGNIKGYKHSDEAKMKISNFQKGRIKSNQERENLSIGHKGHKATDKTKIKMSIAHKGNNYCSGIKQSEISNQKRSKALLGKPISEARRQHMKESWILRKLNAQKYV